MKAAIHGNQDNPDYIKLDEGQPYLYFDTKAKNVNMTDELASVQPQIALRKVQYNQITQ